jgi:hypothetical protein
MEETLFIPYLIIAILQPERWGLLGPVPGKNLLDIFDRACSAIPRVRKIIYICNIKTNHIIMTMGM